MERLDQATIAEVRRLIRKRDFEKALEVHYKVFPESRPTADTKRSVIRTELSAEDLRECFTTPLPVFSFCTHHELQELRERMALGLISGVSPLDKISGARWMHPMSARAIDQNFWMSVMSYRNISDWKREGLVKRARVQNSGDGGCVICRAAAHDYDLRELPSFPIRNCLNLNTVGCRCIAIATKIKGIDW